MLRILKAILTLVLLLAQVSLAQRVSRDSISRLLEAFPKADIGSQSLILETLAANRDSTIDSALYPYARIPEGQTDYFALMYFAQVGDTWALHQLACRQFAILSLGMAVTLKLFGKYRYLPASKRLVDDLDAAVLNLGLAAQTALTEMYPEARIPPRPFPAEAKPSWEKFIRERADTLSCQSHR